VQGFESVLPFTAPTHLRPVLAAFERDLLFAGTQTDADVVHCHTWYSHLGGVLAHLGYGTPLVLTTHSLEPLRPWKREQLGGGYELSSWVERTAMLMADAIIAVSEGTRRDILELFPVAPERVHVIYNGIDLEEYYKTPERDDMARYGIDPKRPYIQFVGRILRVIVQNSPGHPDNYGHIVTHAGMNLDERLFVILRGDRASPFAAVMVAATVLGSGWTSLGLLPLLALRRSRRFALMLLRVQHIELDAAQLQQIREKLRLLHRDRADQHRPAALVLLDHFFGDGAVLRFFGAEDEVGHVEPDHLAVEPGPLRILSVRYLYDRLWYQVETWFRRARHLRAVRAVFSSLGFAHFMGGVGRLFGKRGARHICILTRKDA